jgi:hypothetical protein
MPYCTVLTISRDTINSSTSLVVLSNGNSSSKLRMSNRRFGLSVYTEGDSYRVLWASTRTEPYVQLECKLEDN